MPPIIFNKDISEYSIYDPELQKWELSRKQDERAMAFNMRYDHRVTKARELKFREYFKPHFNLTKALQDYWISEIRTKGTPHFCSRDCNNFVAFCARPNRTHCAGFAGDIDLATVINLNKCLQVVKDTSHAVAVIIPEWTDFEGIDTTAVDYKSNVDVWLDTYLENNYVKKGLDAKRIEPLIDAVIKVLNYRLSAGLIYQPVWVTRWNDFEKYTCRRRRDKTLNVDRWNQVVGVPTTPRTWQIVLRYSANNVPCLHRPSVLDGGTISGQHFPSPPGIRRALGGHTMDLAKDDTRLMSEFIHPQIPLDIDYWIQSGRLLGRTRTVGYTKKIPVNREAHHKKLIHHYGTNRIKSWMEIPY